MPPQVCRNFAPRADARQLPRFQIRPVGPVRRAALPAGRARAWPAPGIALRHQTSNLGVRGSNPFRRANWGKQNQTLSCACFRRGALSGRLGKHTVIKNSDFATIMRVFTRLHRLRWASSSRV